MIIWIDYLRSGCDIEGIPNFCAFST